MKIYPLLIAVCFLLALQACELSNVPQQATKPKPAKPIRAKELKLLPVQHDTLCIAAVGDIMMGTSYPNNNTLPADSGKSSFKAVKQYFKGADVVFGNLEGTLFNRGTPAHYKLHLKSTAYLFRMPEQYGTILRDAGFNVLSIANNHIGDFADSGRISTMKTLDSCGINYGGLLNHPSAVFIVNGVKYGFCAFAPNSQTESIRDFNNARQIIQKLKQQCAIVIVAFHGGGEGAAFEHVTKKEESFFNEKRGNVFAFAHNAIDAGADIVLGTGPHVSRAMEVYKNRLIAYSLGNFCTYKCISVSGVCGMAPLLKIYVNKKGEFLNGRIVAVKQSHDKGLEPDSLNQAVKRIRYLTQMDFPQSGLMIADNGVITPLPATNTQPDIDTAK